MSIIQISKIQQRSGNLVDLPQLNEAEFGFATDAKKLYIGKESPNENIEVLTSYSSIAFSQIDGAVGNLNITAGNLANGEILAYDGNNWVNKGGPAGGLLTLGNVSNVQINGGQNGYVLATDGTGNLSWEPKTVYVAYISDITQANPAVVTTTEENFFTEGCQVTITEVEGMTQINGNNFYYANIINSFSFAVFTDSTLTVPLNSTGFSPYTGNGRVITTVGGSGGATAAGGANTQIQFNQNSILAGDSDFTWNYSTNILTVNGNAALNGGSITTTASTYNLINANATTINFAGAGTDIQIGAGSGNTNINHNLIVDLDAAINGGDLTTTQSTFNLINANATTINFAGAGTDIQIGAGSGNTNINHNLIVDLDANIIGNLKSLNANLGNLATANYVNVANQINGNIANFSGNLTALNANLGNLAQANYVNVANQINGNIANFSGNLTSLNANLGNLATANYVNVSSNIVTNNLTVNLELSGNTANFSGNIVTLNANLGNLASANYVNVANQINGNIANFSGNLTSLNANLGNLAQANYLNVASNIVTNNLTVNLELSGNTANFTGNIVALNANLGNLATANYVNVANQINGNIANFSGNLTSLNANLGNLAQANYVNVANQINGNIANFSGNLTALNANLGNLATANYINVSSNIVTNNLSVNLEISGNTANFTGNITALNANLGNLAQANYVNVANQINGNIANFSGNLTSLNANLGNLAQANYVNVANQINGNIANFSGNLTALNANLGNLATANYVNVANQINGNIANFSGNLTALNANLGNLANANYFSGDGSYLTNVNGGNVSNVANANNSSYLGGVAAANYLLVTGTGGSLTAVNGANVTGQVGNALVSGTVYTNAQPNITSVGTLTSLGVNGAITAQTVAANSNGAGTNFKVGDDMWIGDVNVSDTMSLQGQQNAANAYITFGNTNSAIKLGRAGSGALTYNDVFNPTTLQTTSLTTGANSTAGSITGNWTLTSGSKLEATYADLAEYYEADHPYEPGTVLEFGGDKEVTLATDGTTRVAGVVSTNPAYVMNSYCDGENVVALALQGRVPCKVRGNIVKGDMMISGGNGYARPTHNPIIGSVIGKALQNFNGEGVIEVAVGRL